MTNGSPSLQLINQINDAFNSNDVSAIMPYFTDDACFNTTRGPHAEGTTYQGKEAIAGAFIQKILENIPQENKEICLKSARTFKFSLPVISIHTKCEPSKKNEEPKFETT